MKRKEKDLCAASRLVIWLRSGLKFSILNLEGKKPNAPEIRICHGPHRSVYCDEFQS